MRGLKLGRLFGIRLFADWSVVIVFFLIASSLAMGLLPSWHPDWATGLRWLVGLAAALAFLVSILLHEISHALVAKREGIPVSRITLFLFGGIANIESEPQSPRAEFRMAIVGPLVSLAIGIAATAIAGWLALRAGADASRPETLAAGLGPVATVLAWLGPINVWLALFNLLPGFPLDGGRVLRSILWRITGDLSKATRWASGSGQVLAWALMAVGVAMMLGVRVPVFGVGFGPGLWLVLIGWFLGRVAVASLHRRLMQDLLEDVQVRRLMSRQTEHVPPDVSVEGLVDLLFARPDAYEFAVMSDGQLLGLVTAEDIRKVPKASWASVRVRDIMTPSAALTTIAPEQSASNALDLIERRRVQQLPVIEQGRLAGMLRQKDVARWLELHGRQPG